ncbi:IclR family transcriptional regulator [Aureimonas endophytica]|uniref:IclR family transcriptional regulator n=1 Tax=Aureimonas endophytica TaxID=2027858 RepID=A0A917E8P5_9HYPH|nr:IclR family transcriptional regulator [Aureimonas endophytica]GGE15713.1 IclR family transcriptional regulator [Aureimonas endophytica]
MSTILKPAEAEARYRAPALDKGLDILELLSREPGGLTRAELVKAMGRSPGEVYRMLERLVARDYVARSPEGDRYALTMKLFVLAHRHPPVRRLVAQAQPLMDGFARETGQSCHLAVADRDAALVVAQASGPGAWEFGIRIGASLDLVATGSGQTLLAFLEPELRDDLVRRWEGAERQAAFAAVEAELAIHRRSGYRVAESRQVRGVEDISVPVLAPGGHALAVLTCPYVHRLDGPHAAIAATLTLLRGVAERLSLA